MAREFNNAGRLRSKQEASQLESILRSLSSLLPPTFGEIEPCQERQTPDRVLMDQAEQILRQCQGLQSGPAAPSQIAGPDKSLASKVAQMTRLWGDDSWLDAGYDQIPTLFDHSVPVKVHNERFAEAFRERLEKKAGFKFVCKPMPMKTRNNSVIYYLYFASQKEAGWISSTTSSTNTD